MFFQTCSSFLRTRAITVSHPARPTIPTKAAANGAQVTEFAGLSHAIGERFRLYDLGSRRTDSMIVSKDGQVAFEWHADGVQPDAPHLLFSVSKSLTGLLAELLSAKGRLDLSSRAGDIANWPRTCAFHEPTLRDMMDMTVPLEMIEGDVHGGARFAEYRAAMGWDRPTRPDFTADLAGFLKNVAAGADDVEPRFHYRSATTDALGITVEQATGETLAELLAEHVTGPAGCRDEAFITVDDLGAPRAAGGVAMTPRDLVNIGSTLIDPPDDAWHAALRALYKKCDRGPWLRGDFPELFPDGHYRSGWYLTGSVPDCAIAAIGIHGQWLWVDRKTRTVIVRTASEDQPENDEHDAAVIAFCREVSALGG